MLRESKYQSKIFRDFKTLDMRNYHSIVRFYEDHKSDIEILNIKEAFILELHYCNALFETGNYYKLLEVSDRVVETSIFNNIKYYHGEDIYQKTLFQKAQGYFYLHNFKAAEHIIKELIKLNPNQKEYIKLLGKCIIQNSSPFLKYLQAAGILLFLVSLGIVVIKILIIQSFYPDYNQLFHTITQIGFLAGLSMFGIALALHWHFMSKAVNQVRRAAIERQKSKIIEV